MVKNASSKIYNIGGLVTGAIWSGANYLGATASGEEDRKQEELTVDASGRITYEEIELNKHLDAYMSEEKFLQKYLALYTKLEH